LRRQSPWDQEKYQGKKTAGSSEKEMGDPQKDKYFGKDWWRWKGATPTERGDKKRAPGVGVESTPRLGGTLKRKI